MLASYLQGFDESTGDYEFNGFNGQDFENYSSIYLPEGLWKGLIEHPDWRARGIANKVSYIWDEVVNKISGHLIDGTLDHSDGGPICESEKILRLMASEKRVSRRLLAGCLYEITEMPLDGNHVLARTVFSLDDGKIYVLLAADINDSPLGGYRDARRFMLSEYMTLTRDRFRDTEHIIGIATEHGAKTKSRSYDLAYSSIVLAENQTAFENEVKSVRKRRGLVDDSHLRPIRATVKDFPDGREYQEHLKSMERKKTNVHERAKTMIARRRKKSQRKNRKRK